ncbi:MAG: glutamate synthase [Thermodesulfobacteriota bacterium]
MCRLISITSDTPVSPMVALNALDVMREGHDGSGVGLMLRDLGGPFEDMKDAPILSGIVTESGIRRLDSYMIDLGFLTKYKISVKSPKMAPPGMPKRDIYLIRAYEYPEEWEELTEAERSARLVDIRLKLQEMGREENDMIIFSFWPDTITIKEIGDPLAVGQSLKLDNENLNARVIMAQGRQNTNYAIDLYACHPFFIQGFSTMTNGENTAFVPIREYLMSRDEPGYTGFFSDSEVFVHILHYTLTHLGLGLEAYKHVITPLQDGDLESHPNGEFLTHLKRTCRKLIIDGPNCVIGVLPDNTMFLTQDRKKLRPGVVGGKPGMYVFSSEVCGLDYVLPDRDAHTDFQPMHLDTAIVKPDRREVNICRQTERLPRLH